MRSFEDYEELVAALAPVEGDQGGDLVEHVARRCGEASVLHGIPVYFVQDIETSYYPTTRRSRTPCSPPTGPSSAT